MRGLAFALAAAWILATGCRTFPETLGPLAEGDPRPAAWLARLEARGETRQALRATARVSLSGARGASFARQLLLLERPARLRVEVLGLLGQRVAVLATDGAHYDLYRAETAAVEHGEIHPAILLEVAGVPLTPDEAVTLLLGVPPLPGPDARAFRLADGGVRVEGAGPGGERRRLDFDAEGLPRRYRSTRGEGEPRVEVAWDDYRDVGGVPFAHRVDLRFPRADARAEVDFRSVELNPVLPDALFRLEPLGRVSSRAGGRR